MAVLLDAGPLGMITNPNTSPETEFCKRWFATIVADGIKMIPEIADYEVRRELIRSQRLRGIARLDRLNAAFSYSPITTDTMLRAAEFWAMARNAGRQSADDSALDGDMILAAQAEILRNEGRAVMVATTNARHLGAFCDPRHWSEIPDRS